MKNPNSEPERRKTRKSPSYPDRLPIVPVTGNSFHIPRDLPHTKGVDQMLSRRAYTGKILCLNPEGAFTLHLKLNVLLCRPRASLLVHPLEEPMESEAFLRAWSQYVLLRPGSYRVVFSDPEETMLDLFIFDDRAVSEWKDCGYLNWGSVAPYKKFPENLGVGWLRTEPPSLVQPERFGWSFIVKHLLQSPDFCFGAFCFHILGKPDLSSFSKVVDGTLVTHPPHLKALERARHDRYAVEFRSSYQIYSRKYHREKYRELSRDPRLKLHQKFFKDNPGVFRGLWSTDEDKGVTEGSADWRESVFRRAYV